MKLIVNQAYVNMGLQSTQKPGPVLDGIMPNMPAGREFVQVTGSEGVIEAVTHRDKLGVTTCEVPRTNVLG